MKAFGEWLVGGCCGEGGVLLWTQTEPVIVASALVALGLFALAAWPGVGRLGRAVELLLWAVALAAGLWMIAGPVWVQEGERREEGRFVVLVDGSRSMEVRDPGGAPRSAAVDGILAAFPEAEIYTFGSRLAPGSPAAYDQGDSDLGGALDAISRRYAGERLRGVAVLTDGLDRGGLRRRLIDDPDAPAPPLGGPLTLYQVGEVGAREDVAVTAVRAGSFAFLRSSFDVEVDVRATGRNPGTVPVSLTRDGQPVASLPVTLDDEGQGTVRFEVRPDSVGRYLYEVSVPLRPEDAVPANNALDFAVRVVRDRVRVLQVCGSPSWDQKFLRLFLKEDPAVDLVSFFILRTDPDMAAGYDSSELSLISFPYDRLFSTELATFDLVIFQNFDYAPYFQRSAEFLLQNLADYVRDGGALAMLGGDRSFDLGRYGETALAEVLPVRFGVRGEGVDTRAFQPTLTAAGARHPMTQLVEDRGENRLAWQGLSELDGLNLTLGAAPGAAVLLAHPDLETPGGEPMPVLAVGEYGLGRSMALTVDASWRWSFSEAATGRGNQTYLRFWKDAMRWLIGDPEDQPVVVDAARENVEPGDPVRITVRARDTSFAPFAGARVRVEVSGPGGTVSLDGATGPDGAVTLEFPATTRGAHRVRARATTPGGAALGEARTVFAVSARDPELDEVDPDPAFLQALAAKSGGRFVPAGDFEPPLLDPEAGRRVRDRKETPLWSVPLAVLLAGMSASLSWLLRRRAGLR